ncbi:hypothetical protein FA95DRAFT_1603363 [Auriscalpium vulgare]|uniref:Uncharacterized protein n=1 Tax=Auriscalpium vulgare TaxID=40419 RepID=A0ACB8S3J2_9AGAM|nr:hypothetical protein FA95DRAFT_1603363 [Auriscalpium vulgare]
MGQDMSHVYQPLLAELLFESLGLKGFGPCQSTDFVILLEFVAAQLMNSATPRPAQSLVGAVYQFLFRRAASVSTELPPRSPAMDQKGWADRGEYACDLLLLVGKYPDLSKANPTALACVSYIAIGLETDPRPTTPDSKSAIHAEFLDDRRHYNPDRAVPAETLVDAAMYYLRRRSVRFPSALAVSQEAASIISVARVPTVHPDTAPAGAAGLCTHPSPSLCRPRTGAPLRWIQVDDEKASLSIERACGRHLSTPKRQNPLQ